MPTDTEQLVERLRSAAEVRHALELWFFQDLGETQRRQLFNWCGFPGVEANSRELQEALLQAVVQRLTGPAVQALLAENEALRARLSEAVGVIEPFDDVLGEDDEFPDDTPLQLKWGRTICVASLADLRRARDFLAKEQTR